MLFSVMSVSAQDVYFTKTGKIQFFSKTDVENIDATNNEVTSFFNKSTGELVFAVLIKGFHFEKALMEEHFNENYMESQKFPKADFKGKVTNLASVNFAKDGTYPVNVTGNLTIHGQTKPVTATGTITIAGGKISAQSKFDVALADYKIEKPAVVANKISDRIQITVLTNYEAKK